MSEPFWMNALRSAASEGALMRDTQVIPIVNEGTLGAVLDHIDHLTAQLADVTRERDTLAQIVERVRGECDEATRPMYPNPMGGWVPIVRILAALTTDGGA